MRCKIRQRHCRGRKGIGSWLFARRLIQAGAIIKSAWACLALVRSFQEPSFFFGLLCRIHLDAPVAKIRYWEATLNQLCGVELRQSMILAAATETEEFDGCMVPWCVHGIAPYSRGEMNDQDLPHIARRTRLMVDEELKKVACKVVGKGGCEQR